MEFRLGDRVAIQEGLVNDCSNVGTVRAIYDCSLYLIEIDDYTEGHNGGDYGNPTKHNSGWNISDNYLALIKRKPYNPIEELLDEQYMKKYKSDDEENYDEDDDEFDIDDDEDDEDE